VFAAQPRHVLAEFPMRHILTAPPSAGYLPATVTAQDLGTLRTPFEVCASDFVITARSSPSNPVLEAARALGYLSLWQTIGDTETAFGRRRFTPFWARYDPTLQIYRVSCPSAKH
jgi:hypothetical protein